MAPPPFHVWRQWFGMESNSADLCAQIRIGNNLSQFIKLQHGVRQGSVLSPVLFLLLMDSLLIDLATTEAGILLWVSLPCQRPWKCYPKLNCIIVSLSVKFA